MSAFCARRLRMRFIALPFLAIAACRPPAPPPLAPHLGSRAPADLFAAVRARERSVHTLRAQFVATAVVGNETRRADGVLLIKRPDSVRLRLVSPFGLTVLDYTGVGDRTRLLLPLEGRVIEGEGGAVDPSASPAEFGRLLLRLGDDPAAECTPHGNAGAVSVECFGPDGTLLRTADIDPATATVTREVAYEGGKPEITMELGDYGVIDGVPLPFRLHITYPRTGAGTEIRVRSYEVNPSLDDLLFGDQGGGP